MGGLPNKAVETAGLDKTFVKNISNEDLFEALYELWVRIGGQPNYSDVQKPNCNYHITTYERRFGSWRAALEAFVSYMNEKDTPSPPPKNSKAVIKRTPRSINLRLRFKVISRDNFRCTSCGASPAKNPEVELHIDHIIPYSKGGETLEENLLHYVPNATSEKAIWYQRFSCQERYA